MRPDPITIKDGFETIPLPGGYAFTCRSDVVLSAGIMDRLACMRATHATLTAQADEIDKLKAENAELRRRICETCNGHGMIGGPSFSDPGGCGERCPDCAARDESQKNAERYRSALEDLVSWFPDSPSHEWRIKAGESGADDAIEHARKTIDAAMAKEST